MGRRTRTRRKPVTLPDRPYKPQGPDKAFIEEGEGDQVHLKNVGDHPLDLAYEAGMLGPVSKRRGGERSSLPPHPFLQGDTEAVPSQTAAERRYSAGRRYRGLCEALARSGLDSTQMIDRSRGGDSPIISQAQVDAANTLKRIDTHLGLVDFQIIRHFCGDGYSAKEAVMSATGCHPSNVWFRLRESLDSLSQAIFTAHRKKAA